jgi:hypothetical protein
MLIFLIFAELCQVPWFKLSDSYLGSFGAAPDQIKTAQGVLHRVVVGT